MNNFSNRDNADVPFKASGFLGRLMEINEIPKPWWILPDHFSHRIQFGKRNFTCPSSDFSEFQRVSGFICLMFVYFVYSIDAPPLPVDLRHIAVSEIRVR